MQNPRIKLKQIANNKAKHEFEILFVSFYYKPSQLSQPTCCFCCRKYLSLSSQISRPLLPRFYLSDRKILCIDINLQRRLVDPTKKIYGFFLYVNENSRVYNKKKSRDASHNSQCNSLSRLHSHL